MIQGLTQRQRDQGRPICPAVFDVSGLLFTHVAPIHRRPRYAHRAVVFYPHGHARLTLKAKKTCPIGQVGAGVAFFDICRGFGGRRVGDSPASIDSQRIRIARVARSEALSDCQSGPHGGVAHESGAVFARMCIARATFPVRAPFKPGPFTGVVSPFPVQRCEYSHTGIQTLGDWEIGAVRLAGLWSRLTGMASCSDSLQQPIS